MGCIGEVVKRGCTQEEGVLPSKGIQEALMFSPQSRFNV